MVASPVPGTAEYYHADVSRPLRTVQLVRAAALACVSVALMLAVPPPPAAALSCAVHGDLPGIIEQTLTGELEEAAHYEAFFVATVTDVRPRGAGTAAGPDYGTWGADVDVEVSVVFRGNLRRHETIFAPPTGLSGIRFMPGRQYFVVTFTDPENGLSASACTPTREVTDAEVQTFISLARPLALYPDTAVGTDPYGPRVLTVLGLVLVAAAATQASRRLFRR